MNPGLEEKGLEDAMNTPAALAQVADSLRQQFGDDGANAAGHLERWLAGEVPLAHSDIIARLLEKAPVAQIFDEFYQVLPVGTGGRRGRVGYGPNRINPTTVAMSIQGHCNYLKELYPGRDDLTVVVGNDVRTFHDIAGTYQELGDDHPLVGVSSRSLGQLACRIYASNGITAYFAQPDQAEAVLSTPELSFLITRLDTVGGVNLSASHNPPDDNGLKLYDARGSQPIAPQDQHVVDAMNAATEVNCHLEFADALSQGLIRAVPAETHDEYLDLYAGFIEGLHTPDPEIPIVYTPMCGCGQTTVGELLDRLGFPVSMPPEEQHPDGSFAPIPFRIPNPEVPQSTQPAKDFADSVGSTIVLSSDPDADRVGLEIKLQDGSWYHCDGNQIATILTYFMMLDPAGPKRRGLVLETLVTTKILRRIVEEATDSWIIDDLLVGFKYVADTLGHLETSGEFRGVKCAATDLVIAAEESHGVIMAPSLRDKDASPACLLFAALHQRLQAEGQTLLDYYTSIIERFGRFDTVNRSIMLAGASGMVKKDGIMASLRETPPTTIGGAPVQRIVDYWDQDAFGPFVSETDRLPRNVLQIFTETLVVTVRPSGTEPKLKLYCQLLPDGKPLEGSGPAMLDPIRENAHSIARQVYRELLQRIDLDLGEVGLIVPDIVDFDQKHDFEFRIIPELETGLQENRWENLDGLLGWLREQVAAMTPGANPLPAIQEAVAHFCASRTASGDLHDALQTWANDTP